MQKSTQTKTLSLIGFSFALGCQPTLLHAEDQLETIYVFGEEKGIKNEDFKSISGQAEISESELKVMPSTNGDMNEVLRILPGVELTDPARTSSQAGEIKPGTLSINGAKGYENNFLVDGLSNNSLLDPGETNANTHSDVEGHPQEVFINTDILRSLDVYTSNIPARYGQFAGGVIDAKTIRANPGQTFGKLTLRHTSDQLTEFHLGDRLSDQETFEDNDNVNSFQPEFQKLNLDLLLHQPINDNSAFYINLARKYSKIPFYHLGKPATEERTSYNAMIKASHFFSNDHILDISLMHSPYEAKKFIKNYKDSEYFVEGGGTKLNAELESHIEIGEVQTRFSISESHNSRRSSLQDLYNWQLSNNADWGKYYSTDSYGQGHSYQGGLGNLNKQQVSYLLKSDVNVKKGLWAPENHLISFGYDYKHIDAQKERLNDNSIYLSNNVGVTNLRCQGAEVCIEGDQFASEKLTRYASKRSASTDNLGAYIEDAFKIDRFLLRLGARYDYNTFLHNHDVAYRTFAKYDLFKNKKHFISTGLNRYYSNSFLTYQLKQAGISYGTAYRGLEQTYIDGQKVSVPDEWTESATTNTYVYQHSNLKTPYQDELSVGIQSLQTFGNLGLEFVSRQGRNAFTRHKSAKLDDGLYHYTLKNGGKSDYANLRFTWQKQVGVHLFRFNLTKVLKDKSNYVSYNENDDDDEGVSQSEIVYQGKLMNQSDFNLDNGQPINAKLFYGYTPTKGINLGVYVNFIQGTRKFEDTGYDAIIGIKEDENSGEFELANIYDYFDYKDLIQVDVNIGYVHNTSIGDFHYQVDIHNLFDQVNTVAKKDDEYLLGRQFWLGVTYLW
ncbi:TonB-dependent receptor plug domain-containing protein [Thiomicrorhabdus sp.]|uniref:TonB-dependent receptor plug domain-containing protein n=1 Tax=Thiomicrorhabdus sp. TaxID=2039724 RepID=UPI0029C6580C|nr:TonB-dependent receptor plug domain-containing protein [Thiomicrorhabdus sp.]